MNARRFLLMLLGLLVLALLAFSLTASAQGRPGVDMGATAAHSLAYLGPGGGGGGRVPTDTLITPPTPGTPTVLPVPAAPTEHLFDIPAGEDGISVWSGTEGLYGIAAMPDGSFWVGDWSKTATVVGGRLLHYTRQGMLVGVTPAPGGDRDMGGMVRDLEAYGTNLWAVVNSSLYGIGEDEKVTSINPLPDEIDGKAVISSAIELGPDGEVMLVSGQDSSRAAQLLDASGKLAGFTSGSDDKTNIASMPGFPAPGGGPNMYRVTLDSSTGAGTLTVGGKAVVVRVPYSIVGLHILRVIRDGSVLVMAERDVGGHDNSGDIHQSVLLFGSDGTLLGRSALPIAGHFIDVVRKIAVDDAGSVYVLYQSGQRAFSVDRLNFYPPSVTPPQPFLPTSTPTYAPPTATPTPTGLQGLARDAHAIADVDVTYSFTDGAVLRVRSWIKPFEIQIERDEGPYDVPYLNVAGNPSDMRLLVKGRRYVLFMTDPTPHGDCVLAPEEFNLTDGKLGVFEVQGNRIGSAAISGYAGMALSDFEAGLLKMVAGNQYNPVPPVVPDNGPADLMALSQSADLIAEVSAESGGAGAGRYFYSYHVKEWLKKPAGFPTDDLGMSFTTSCDAIPRASSDEHLIIFLTVGQQQGGDGNTHIEYALDGGDMGIIRANPDGIVRWAGIGHYRGWAFTDLERAIREDVRLAGSATPTHVPVPTPGSSQAP